MYWLLLGLSLITLFGIRTDPVRAAAAPACAIPAQLTTPDEALSHVAVALTKRGTVDILALGSGSTVGDPGGAAGPAFARPSSSRPFPYEMAEAMQSMRPGTHVQLTVKGGRSMTAETMLDILRQELSSRHYDLVLWQTGTVEAVHGSRPDALRAVLQDGVDATAAAHADLVLIDSQFSRFLRANTDLNPYETVLQQMTTNPGVTLFHRFELTQSWVSSGEIDLERASHDQRDKAMGLLNLCLGRALAKYVLSGIEEH
jgi:hypothetical protein